nr:unnamed protein product [Digitaria exilis]
MNVSPSQARVPYQQGEKKKTQSGMDPRSTQGSGRVRRRRGRTEARRRSYWVDGAMAGAERRAVAECGRRREEGRRAQGDGLDRWSSDGPAISGPR